MNLTTKAGQALLVCKKLVIPKAHTLQNAALCLERISIITRSTHSRRPLAHIKEGRSLASLDVLAAAKRHGIVAQPRQVPEQAAQGLVLRLSDVSATICIGAHHVKSYDFMHVLFRLLSYVIPNAITIGFRMGGGAGTGRGHGLRASGRGALGAQMVEEGFGKARGRILRSEARGPLRIKGERSRLK